MARIDKVQTNFTKGILSPRLRGRMDFAGFFDGATRLENVIVMAQGGVIRRSGTRFVAVTKQSAPVRILRFKVSTEQTYVVEVGAGYMRFFTQEGRLFATTVTASVSNGNFPTDISGWTDLSLGTGTINHDTGGDGGRMELDGGGGAANLAKANQAIGITETTTDHVFAFDIEHGFNAGEKEDRGAFVRVRVGTASGLGDLFEDTFRRGGHTINVDPNGNAVVHLSFEYDGAASMFVDDVKILSNVPIEIKNPYAQGDLSSIKFTQSADIMYLDQSNHEPRELRRTSATTFSLVEHDFLDGPYDAINTTPTTITASATTGRLNLTLSSVIGVNNDQGWLTTDIGRLVRVENRSGGGWIWYEIVERTSATVAVVEQQSTDAGTLGATASWRLGAWHDTGNWPETPQFHEQRLWHGASAKAPQTGWSSKSADFINYEPSDPTQSILVTDASAITFTVDSNTVNRIRWYFSTAEGLFVGTSDSEALIRPASTAKGLTPDNTEIRIQSQHGSAALPQPIGISDFFLFIQRDQRELRTATFDFINAGFKIESVTILAEKLFRLGLERIEFAQAPIPVLWAITNGKLASLTAESNQGIFAWTEHPLGGTDVDVEDMAVIQQGLEDQLWLSVARTINSSTVRHIEFVETLFEEELKIEDAFFVDSGLTGAPVGLVVSGLDHLEGETVAVLLDGAAHPPRTVSSGQITLQITGTKVHVGLKQTALLELFPLEEGEQTQTTFGRSKRTHAMHIRFLNTVGATAGSCDEFEDVIPFRDPSVPMNQAVQPFSGTKSITISQRWTQDVRLCVFNDQPLPFQVLNIIGETQVHGSGRQ